jgi:ATP-binding cassette subfamily B protein
MTTAKNPQRARGNSAPSATEARLRAFHEEGSLGKAYDAKLLRRLWPFVKPHARHLVLSLGVLFVVGGLNLVRPLVMGAVVRHAADHDRDGLLRDGLLLTGLVLAAQLLGFVQLYQMQIAGARAMADLREAVFRYLQSLTLRFFDKTPVGRLVTRATNDVDALGELFAQGVANAVGDIVSLVGYVIAMTILDWKMALIAFAAMPIVLVIVTFVRKRSRQAYRDIRTKTARLNAFLGEQVNGVSIVQAYGRERAAQVEFDVINESYRDANKRSIYYEAVLDAAIEMVATLCIASILLWVAFHRAHIGHAVNAAAAFALVVTFTGYIKQFFEPISLLSQRYTILQSAMSGAERIFQLLDTGDVEKNVDVKECAPDRPNEALSFENVTFEYKSGSPVLRDVTITAAPGEKIALVGATGSGKTTIASLLLRLYEVTKGVVRVSGRDVRRFDRIALREQFAVVPQDVYLFSGTLLTNVAMADAKPDRARAIEALERVGAAPLFKRRAGADEGDGWIDAPVDERGSNFSAGERQLIAFARALYRDAPFVILDEATASVDSDTEARLQRALEAVLEKRTAVIIAHRLSTIKAADRIVVLHKGVVVEHGTHEELLALNGVYAKLHRLQFSAQEEADAVA